MSAAYDHEKANPRYVNYARSRCNTMEQQMADDKRDWPGGTMTGFILWNNERIKEFGAAHPEAMCVSGLGLALLDHAAYDKWLTAWATRAADRYARAMTEGCNS